MPDHHDLIQEIRRYCAACRWYGADLRGPEWETGVAENDPRRTTFAFPPVTGEQLQETEELLGFALPALLQALQRVAEGLSQVIE